MPNSPGQIYRAEIFLSDSAQFNSRTPPGHPEGYLEAFKFI
jgi:hypothetical protein